MFECEHSSSNQTRRANAAMTRFPWPYSLLACMAAAALAASLLLLVQGCHKRPAADNESKTPGDTSPAVSSPSTQSTDSDLAGAPRAAEQLRKTTPVEADFPPGARVAVYSPTAAPTFNTPEGVTRLLEKRWSIANIRAFCIPERRHNTSYQNLVVDSPVSWKGRLYSKVDTGFDSISWYATVTRSLVKEYSLGASRGDDFWLIEIGTPESIRTPPDVTPDPSAPYFVGHK